jgi:hypothetical protein
MGPMTLAHVLQHHSRHFSRQFQMCEFKVAAKTCKNRHLANSRHLQPAV